MANWVGIVGKQVAEVHDVDVALVGDRRYVVPSICQVAVTDSSFRAVSDDEQAPRFHVSVEVGVRDGQPHFRSVNIQCYDAVTPRELQRLPWARIAEAAVVANATGEQAQRSAVQSALRRDAGARRVRSSRTAHAENEGHRSQRQAVTDERLRTVLRLRAEAERHGLRYDAYVGRKLGYTPAHVRRLVATAKTKGIIAD